MGIRTSAAIEEVLLPLRWIARRLGRVALGHVLGVLLVGRLMEKTFT